MDAKTREVITVGSLMLIATVSCTTSPPSLSDGGSMSVINELFPNASDVTELPMDQGSPQPNRPDASRVSEISSDTGRLGYWVESQVVSRSGPFKIRVLLDAQLYVKQAAVVSYPWAVGRGVCRPAFTRQFEGKGPGDPLQLGTDIDAMSGATISSRVMTEGIRDIIRQLSHVNGRPELLHNPPEN